MKRFYNKKGFYFVILGALLWAAISSYWYVCGIKNFCENTDNAKVSVSDKSLENDNFSGTRTIRKVVKKRFTCSPYIEDTIILGKKNDKNEVAKLEKFLFDFENENISVDGVYSSADKNKVIDFQRKYTNSERNLGSDGVVGENTKRTINEMYCIQKGKEYLKNNKK